MKVNLRGRVRGGHIVVEDVTDLPEGTEVELALLDIDAELDDEDRLRLQEELRLSLEEAGRGETLSSEESLARVRARRR